MKVMILAEPEQEWQILAAFLQTCSVTDAEISISRCGLDDALYAPPDSDTAAVFAFVDDIQSLTAARKVADWDARLPLVFVCKSPDYAMEAIRLGVRHYLLQPLKEADVEEAVNRILEARSVMH